MEAGSLSAKAKHINPRNMLMLLGLWITHARLGNTEEAENFQRRFEESNDMESRIGNFTVIKQQEKETISSFEEVKQFIAVQLSVQAEYQRIMSIALVYAQLLMSNQYQYRFHSLSFR
ncbi:hypothetical protein VU04_07820 [Desulfobulbus sp. TB]|nr:hypothetical protein [Desulfobulbus sp. TB]